MAINPEKDERVSDGINLGLLVPLLGAAALMQFIIPLARIAASYRAIELNLSLEQIGACSSAFALLPVLFAVRIGRHNDRHGEGGTSILGAAIVALSVVSLWFWSTDFWSILGWISALGIGQVMLLSALQMMTTRCSGQKHYDDVLSYFLVALSLGQVVGPLAISLATPVGTLYPDSRLYWALACASLALLLTTFILRRGLPPHVPQGDKAVAGIATTVRTPGLIAIMLSSSLLLTANDLVVVFVPVLCSARGIDAAVVGLLLSGRAVAMLLSRFAFSPLVARFSKMSVMAVAMTVSAVATAALVLDLPVWGIGILLAMAGFAVALSTTCSLSLTLAVAPPNARATAMSLRLTISRLGQFVLPLGAGVTAGVLGAGSVFGMIGLALIAGVGLVSLSISKNGRV